MELKYGDGKTYNHKLDDEQLKSLISKTYRSKTQTQFLFNLVDGDLDKLKELESLADYLQKRIQYEIGQNSDLIDNSLECIKRASVLAIDLRNLIGEAQAWMIDVEHEKS